MGPGSSRGMGRRNNLLHLERCQRDTPSYEAQGGIRPSSGRCGCTACSSKAHDSARSPGSPKTISSTQPALPMCSYTGLVLQAVPPTMHESHNAADARDASTKYLPSDDITRVTPAWVSDPIAFKVGLPKGRRVMWVLWRTHVYSAENKVGHGPVHTPSYPDGTVFRSVTLIDDLTLQSGGNLSCGPPELPSSH